MIHETTTSARYADPVTFTWPIDRTNLPAVPVLGDSPTDDQQAAYDKAVLEQRAAAQLAVTVMWALTGRQWGLDSTTVRPCRFERPHHRDGGYAWRSLWYRDGAYFNWPCGCHMGCEIGGPRAVHLPGPVHAVTEVRIAGVVLDPSGYSLEGNVLYRVGGPWPHQDLGRPVGEALTWSVTYDRGYPVPDGVDILTGILAKEFAAAISASDGNKCRLPRTVTTASRNGVTYRAYDPAVIYANGKTGLPEVDLMIAAVNPHALSAPPSVI